SSRPAPRHGGRNTARSRRADFKTAMAAHPDCLRWPVLQLPAGYSADDCCLHRPQRGAELSQPTGGDRLHSAEFGGCESRVAARRSDCSFRHCGKSHLGSGAGTFGTEPESLRTYRGTKAGRSAESDIAVSEIAIESGRFQLGRRRTDTGDPEESAKGRDGGSDHAGRESRSEVWGRDCLYRRDPPAFAAIDGPISAK